MAHDPIREKQLYNERVERGICTRCGIRPSKPGIRLCLRCSVTRHERYERMKARRGVYQGVPGRRPVYRYTVKKDGETIFSGTSTEVAHRFRVSRYTVYMDAKTSRVMLGEYRITRELIEKEATPHDHT